MMLASGTNLATVRDILGHANISTTEKYPHASGQSLRGAAANIESYLDKALNKKGSILPHHWLHLQWVWLVSFTLTGHHSSAGSYCKQIDRGCGPFAPFVPCL